MKTTPNQRPGSGRVLLRAGGALLLVLLLVWLTRVSDGLVHIVFLDTPGDAVLVQTPHGRHMLIDGGEDPGLLALHLGERLPFWKRTLEVVVLSRGDMARLPGHVAAITRYRPERVLASRQMLLALAAERQQASMDMDALPAEQSLASGYLREWVRVLDECSATLIPVQQGSRLSLDGVVLSVLAEGSEQPGGLVMQVGYGATTVLLAGASDTSTDAVLLPTARPVTVLLYPWERPMDTPLVRAWQPQAIVFSTAYDTDLPALHTFAERAQDGAALYHPRLHGTVEMVSDGRRVWVR